MRAIYLTLIASIVIVGCDSSSSKDIRTSKNSDNDITQESSDPIINQKLPTATEVFNLRTECNKLGEHILNENALDKSLADALEQDASSHYDPTTNRCYVKISLHHPDPAKIGEKLSGYLYDGQTGQQIANYTIENGEVTEGNVFVKGLLHNPNALNYVNAMMNDEDYSRK